MIWVSIKKRKPTKDGFYYWIGKSNCGGRALYNLAEEEFDFDDTVPTNKVDDDYLYWLDETNAKYEHYN